MKYGMPTLLEFTSIEENINFAKENNLDFIELNMNLPYCFNLAENSLTKYNYLFTMHISEELNIGELNENIRKKYLEEIIRQINLGISNNIKKYTIHLNSGIYFTLPNGKSFLNNKYLDLYKEQIQKSADELNKIATENNININFENTKIEEFTKVAINIIKDYSNLGFTLDIGHNEKNKNLAYPLFVKTNKIKHIHMHDYDLKNDHLPLGKGQIDFSKYTDVLKNNYVVIEIKETKELLESIDYIKNRLN